MTDYTRSVPCLLCDFRAVYTAESGREGYVWAMETARAHMISHSFTERTFEVPA